MSGPLSLFAELLPGPELSVADEFSAARARRAGLDEVRETRVRCERMTRERRQCANYVTVFHRPDGSSSDAVCASHRRRD